MANKKFSDFTQKTSTADVDFVVGYDGSDNVRISPSNLTADSLPLAGGTMTGDIAFSSTSNGVKLGGSGSGNLLKDYEEGTYNLQFELFKIGTTTSSITITSSDFGYFDNESTYTKIGNKVTLYIDLKYQNPTNTNWTTPTTWYLGLRNFPFAPFPSGTSPAPMGGTYNFDSSFHMDSNTGNSFYMVNSGYNNYGNTLAFKSSSNTINYGWRPLFSSEAPTYYSPSSGSVHLTGIITYTTNV